MMAGDSDVASTFDGDAVVHTAGADAVDFF